MSSITKLYHVYDPMCSWCWAYKPAWGKVKQALAGKVEIVYLLGGLAPDSSYPMPQEMREQIASFWLHIEREVGTKFNHDFWTENTPRRSTYPSCRAALAARSQDAEEPMLAAIQSAYYLEARNPSDNEVLIDLARQIGLDENVFEKDFLASKTHDQLLEEIRFARSIGGNSFPSLFVEQTLEGQTVRQQLAVNYQDPGTTIQQVQSFL